MGSCNQQQAGEEWRGGQQLGLAKALAPEDIRVGEFVAVLHIISELPSFLWCVDSSQLPEQEPIRIRWVPEAGGTPLKVKSICLPFVLVVSPTEAAFSLDVRQHRLARLAPDYALASWKAHRKAAKRARKNR